MKANRAYSMDARSASMEATRDRIVGEAQRLFLEQWYDDVTLTAIAREAGVSGQTVLNHFGDKEGVFSAVIERTSGELQGRRDRAQPGDVAGAIEALVGDYEITGDATIRLLAVEHRVQSAHVAMELGRTGHREWVERIFQAPSLTSQLLVVTDVYAWKLLRRDQRKSRKQTVASIQRMVQALLDTEPSTSKTK